MANDTLLRQRGAWKRMKCSSRVAHIIAKEFVTVEEMVEAVESDKPLTNIHGIGPATADAINEWYEHRFERERAMDETSVEQTSSRSVTIHNHTSWADAIGMEE